MTPQDETEIFRAHVIGCPTALSVPVDRCACGGRDIVWNDEHARANRLEAEVAQLRQDRARLQLLQHYAQHTNECELLDTWTAQMKCTCGLAYLLAVLTEPEG